MLMSSASWVLNYCEPINDYRNKCRQFKTPNVTALSVKLDNETLILTPKQYSYLIKFKVISKPDSIIENECGDPNCINPQHLIFNQNHTLREYEGKKETVSCFTEKLKQIKEMKEKVKKIIPRRVDGPGRGNHNNHRTTFTAEQMKIVADSSYTPQQIADMFKTTVNKVNNARSYYKAKNK